MNELHRTFSLKVCKCNFPKYQGQRQTLSPLFLITIIECYFTHFAMFDNIVEKLSTRHIFHHHKNICWSGNNLIELDNMRMSKKLQILDFSPDLANDIQTLDFLTIQNLHSHFMIGNLVKSHWKIIKAIVFYRNQEVEIDLESNFAYLWPCQRFQCQGSLQEYNDQFVPGLGHLKSSFRPLDEVHARPFWLSAKNFLLRIYQFW